MSDHTFAAVALIAGITVLCLAITTAIFNTLTATTLMGVAGASTVTAGVGVAKRCDPHTR